MKQNIKKKEKKVEEEKKYIVDFECWIVTAKNEEEVYKKIEERLCGGELPKVGGIKKERK